MPRSSRLPADGEEAECSVPAGESTEYLLAAGAVSEG
jgi:hypothetical protein